MRHLLRPAARTAPLFVALCLTLLAIFAASPAPAQDAAPAVGARVQLDRVRSRLDQAEATLKRPTLTDAVLQQVRAAVDPDLDILRGIVAEAAPLFETMKARVAQLGPRPEASAGPESPEIARERAERERAQKEAEDTLALARTLAVQAEQIVATVNERRRSQFARQLFERTSSPLSPWLWWQVAQGAPRDAAALGTTLSDWSGVAAGARPSQWLLLALGIAGAAVVLGPATWMARRYGPRIERSASPGRGEKALRAAMLGLLGAARPILAAYVFAALLDASGLLPSRIAPAVFAAVFGLAMVMALGAIARAALAPEARAWRLPAIDDANAAILARVVTQGVALHMTAKVVETVGQSIGAGLSIAIATRAVFALLFVAAAWRALSASAPKDPSEEACLGPYVPPAVTLAGPIRLALAAALVTAAAAALAGFVAFAAFVIDQIIWIGVVGAGLYILLILIEEWSNAALAPTSRAARLLHESVGLRQRSIEQLAVVAVGIFKLLTCFAAALLAIAPWGVESGDILASVRAALFGFRIGDVTISFSAVVAAATVFGIGIFLTRSTQRWLDEKLLPRTDLDSGLRNSIRTALGYAGVVVAGALAISSLGLSLDRIAIIAGALSVGIGFGLQSIVNNFVSGLILLWERPIRVGDLIDVGGDQGIVRRINVRSTEVETFDRATVIMPNSNLVSGVVKNRVHSDRTGRVLIALNVPRSSDPDAVAAMLAETAAAHGEVMRKPPPIVNFKKIGDAALEFELVCCVFDVDDQARVASDLHFDIFRKLGPLLVPAAPAKYAVEGAEEVAEALRRIADALGEGPRKAAPSAAAKPA